MVDGAVAVLSDDHGEWRPLGLEGWDLSEGGCQPPHRLLVNRGSSPDPFSSSWNVLWSGEPPSDEADAAQLMPDCSAPVRW